MGCHSGPGCAGRGKAGRGPAALWVGRHPCTEQRPPESAVEVGLGRHRSPAGRLSTRGFWHTGKQRCAAFVSRVRHRVQTMCRDKLK